MKVTVKFSCGHTKVVELFGRGVDRESRIAYYEKYGICSDCYKEKIEINRAIKYQEVEMSYIDYRTNFKELEAKKGSYNGINKTIIVYVPRVDKSIKSDERIQELFSILNVDNEKLEKLISVSYYLGHSDAEKELKGASK